MAHSENAASSLRTPLAVDDHDSGWMPFMAKPPAETPCLVYAVADIHGHDYLLEEMLDKIEQDMQETTETKPLVIFLGDYIDRGPDAKRVVDLLIRASRVRNMACVFLLGNHEQWLIDFMHSSVILPVWGCQGGLETLLSYGVPQKMILSGILDAEVADEVRHVFLDLLPESHLSFFQSLVNHFELGDYFFVHAGIDPNRPLHQQRKEDLIWIRHPFLSSKQDFGKVIVHGHTPSEHVESLPNRINLDSGIYIRHVLNCAVLEGSCRYLIQASGG
ncbi:metallophosphoesterase family protein [Vibrio mangrovi]|uniref:Diadenosine tetraphosphatase n=1 Tax=Vibrio mangrovi TaxID=474394 RepID=A0A1Y6IWT9_9VIBR|nr:metallophosphoesterase family protein [Vibrio mangrovi]MDW6004662.1 metallophosphoesterase family protein [Vibrio mangrovi]SMS00952.1 diadenosine tetraphosphatase [Vibrio mangrovi]